MIEIERTITFRPDCWNNLMQPPRHNHCVSNPATDQYCDLNLVAVVSNNFIFENAVSKFNGSREAARHSGPECEVLRHVVPPSLTPTAFGPQSQRVSRRLTARGASEHWAIALRTADSQSQLVRGL